MEDEPVTEEEIDAVMRASRVLIAVAAKSIAEVEDVVTPPQLRVLVLIATRGAQTPTSVADDLGVHPSNATRTCDRLVRAHLIERGKNPQDRRSLQLSLTTDGTALVSGIMARRRAAVTAVVQQMPLAERQVLASALTAFSKAAGEAPSEADPASLGLSL